MIDGVLFAGEVETVQTRRDKTFKIILGTPELAPARAAELFGLMNKVVAVYISPKETLNQKEIDQVDKINPEFGGKTNSQRLRNVLYKLFDQSNEGFNDFDSYYKHHTEIIIEHLKKKINP